MDDKHVNDASAHKRILIGNLHSSLMPDSPASISQVMTQYTATGPTGSNSRTSSSQSSSLQLSFLQTSSLQTSEFCELSTKLDRESLMKVNSMLVQPSRYLEDVPIFGIGEAEGEVPHTDLPVANIDLTARMSILGLPSNLEGKGETSSGILASVVDGGESKETKMDLLNSAPFLVSEEGVMFQCFPISEKEVIIVSLNDSSLIINDSVAGHLPAISESNSGGSSSHLRICPLNNTSTESKVGDAEKKVNISLIQPMDGAISGTSSQDVTSSVILSSNEHESSYNTPAYDMTPSSVLMKNCASGHIKHVGNTVINSLPHVPTNIVQCSNVAVNRKGKLNCMAEGAKESCQKETEITHATIYTPFLRKPRNLAADSEEQMSSAGFKCSMCSDILPCAATLRHHLVKQHQQKDIKSFLCFLCKHECWSESQQDWHLRVHHGIKNKAVACFVCGAQLSTPTERKAHVRKHLATLTCPSCSLKFSAQHQLVAHVKQHLEKLRPHCCLLCGARFSHAGTLQVHSWRHRPQKCTEEGCRHVTEDESWLVVHLQNQHTLTGRQIQSIIAVRNASDHNMDLLLGKYSSLYEIPSTGLSSYNSEKCFTSDDLKSSSTGGSAGQLKHAESERLTSCSDQQSQAAVDEDCNIFKDVVNCLVETVAIVEEEQKKGLRREEEILQKVTEEGPTMHRCGLCNIYLPSAEELAAHKSGHNQAIICLKCQKSFLSVKQLKRHMTVHNSQEGSKDEAEKHRVPHEYRCLECGKICASESALSRHRGTHARSLGRHQCQTCKRRVRTRNQLTEHMARVHKINHESKKLQCPMCDRRFTSKIHLESHLLAHGEREPLWSCDKCDRNYVRPRSLQRHMAMHDHKYVCSTCNESFNSAHRLSVHSRIHDPSHKKRLSCPKCPQQYAYESQLQVHMRIHTGEKPYVCETCGKCFKRIQQCHAHHRMIHGNHKETCVECGKTFGDKTNLLRHRLMVHYHLKRWVCGVCAQSYAYSQDLRNHLQKQHSLEFERLDGTNKRSRHEVYVVPELGSQDLSQAVQRAVESVCALEHRKVQQVLCSTSSSLKKSRKTEIENSEDVDNPDDPALLHDNPLTIASLVVNDPPPIKETAVTATSILVPSATIAIPTVIEASHIQTEEKTGQTATTEREVQGFVRLTGINCVECGVETTTPLQCGPCGAFMCSQAHLDIHAASNHRVMFQCSVCGVHYGSQGECVAHVTAAHSSHLLAVQGGATTYLPQQPSQSIQINGGGTLPPQLCMPLAHSQPVPQGLVQVAGHSHQVPLVIAPATANAAEHQIETNNVILQYPNVNSLSASFPILPHSAVVDSTRNPGKQPIFTMTGVLSGHQQTLPRNLRKDGHTLDKQEKQPGPSVCAITFPSSNDGGLMLPTGEASSINFSSVQNITSLPTIFPRTNSNGENSTFLMGDVSINTQTNDSEPVLLVGSLPFSNISTGSPAVLSQHKQCNLSNQTSTSVASVLLTLAEASPNGPAAPLVPSDLPRVTEEEVKQDSPIITRNMPLQKTWEEEEPNTGDGSNLLQSLVELPVSAEEGNPSSGSSSLPNVQVPESICTQEPPHEVSVEIIQPRPRRSKAQSKKAKLHWEKAVSRTKRGAEDQPSNSADVNLAFQCSTCGKNFQSKACLERHQRTHNGQRFKCQLCDKAFTEKYNLKTHMLMHTHERPHVCNQCPKSFRYIRDLKEHKRNHEGSRPHVCKICEKGFVRWRDYTRHYREQHGTQRHQCQICGSSFKRRLYLETVHMRTRHPQVDESTEEKSARDQSKLNKKETNETKETHICRICGRAFARARYLTSHLRTHSRRADYVRCPRCPRMFTSERTLKVHTEAFHDRETNNTGFNESNRKQMPVQSVFPELEQPQTSNISVSKPSVPNTASSSAPNTSQSIMTSRLAPLSSSEVASHLLQPPSHVITEHPSHCSGEELERSIQDEVVGLTIWPRYAISIDVPRK
nr:uncharacterized protein LOC123756796 [Procambarus clarkii]XP_045596089.1 uncharacterized protein LOC123756796 [Procambarus clarkii]XP_045596091.1 uncharacterized protein LOC123756796 [Procambarus clarkii]